MIKIGITGGIGSGKSVVSHLFGIMGVPIYISDVEAKRLTAHDPVIRELLISLLGDEVYQDEKLNKALLASYLFANSVNMNVVNSIIHPRVKQDFLKWIDAHAVYEVVGMEAAILIEAGFAEEVDKIVMVYAPLEIRLQRAMLRDSSSREQIMKRIQMQMSDEIKMKRADFVIYNDGERPLMPQVASLIAKLQGKENP
ncbi:dephospho-CoA kinase [uncultured Bacteroides sp.]|uniref:dephospho-CoA kinase n=1 Tax=uncultured Bacteroides sp. TaxID=162156 RepID=UPI002AA89E1C|nr:dephospho-CoA kinase [uncultured Bacteroides sp.]